MFIFLFILRSPVGLAFTALVLGAATPALALSGPECLRQAYPEFWAPQVNAASDQALVSFTGQRFEFDEHKDHLPHAQLLNP